MKTLPTLFATAVVVALILAPLTVSAAGSVTFSSPTTGSTVKAGSYTISGTVTPAPGQPDSVGITVKNPSSSVVDTEQASVDPTTGAFSLSAVAGGPLWTASGTYTVSAVDSFSASGSTSFTFTIVTTPQYNVTRALINIQGNLTRLQAEMTVLQKDEKNNATQEQTALTSITSALTTLTSNLNTLSGSVNTLQTGVTGIASQVTSIASQVGTINTAVSGLSTQVANAATQATNAANAVSSTQTYVLVVAVLAAITLVLELAILVRKLS
jgi:trimeric autotransporter adhesin